MGGLLNITLYRRWAIVYLAQMHPMVGEYRNFTLTALCKPEGWANPKPTSLSLSAASK